MGVQHPLLTYCPLSVVVSLRQAAGGVIHSLENLLFLFMQSTPGWSLLN